METAVETAMGMAPAVTAADSKDLETFSREEMYRGAVKLALLRVSLDRKRRVDLLLGARTDFFLDRRPPFRAGEE